METSHFPVALIPLLPLAGAVLNLFFGKRLGKGFVAAVGCTTVAGAALCAWIAAARLYGAGPEASFHGALFDGDWFFASELTKSFSIHIAPGLLLDRLSSLMTLVVTTCGFLIHLYSSAYMEEDEGYHRYFSYLNLFTAAMLILVLGDSLPVTFVGWEGVGLCSYLLIGFWFSKEANASAGRKAFIVNRIGDFGFLLGMFMIFAASSTLAYGDFAAKGSTAVQALQAPFHGHALYGTVAALLLFIGCCGKSAQLPLYIWLPDAMAGPTPVSALIHAATMVTAGVYLVARMHVLFEIDPFVQATVACVGAATALFAATIGLAQRPIKKILAYSTVSQLGFMFIGVGTGAYTAGLFHLVTHAFFKAGLFLGAGSIMHALGGEEDVMKMGGLARKLPITRWTFLIYCLAIAGIFPFAGFFSKDAILAGAFMFDYPNNPVFPHWLGHALYGVGLVAALCTAFYMFRAYFLVFHGDYRGDEHVLEHAHESPPAMTIPLVLLAAGAVGLGVLGLPSLGDAWKNINFMDAWLEPVVGVSREPATGAELGLMGVATLVALAGVGLAWRLYGKGISAGLSSFVERAPRLYKLVFNKYYVDEIYDFLIVRRVRWLAWFCWKVIDGFVIDLVMVRGSALVVDMVGRSLRYLQNGDAQRYVVGVLVGTALLLITGSNWIACSASGFDVEAQGTDVYVRARGMSPGQPQRQKDQTLRYTFEFGDGTPPLKQDGPVARHHFASAGKKEIKVTVVDPLWKTTSRRSRTVVLK